VFGALDCHLVLVDVTHVFAVPVQSLCEGASDVAAAEC
jgi:hypothetical protein